MQGRQVLMSAWVALALIMMISAVAGAGVVGHLTQLEGRVDLLKGGNLPAIPLKVDDTVEPGDVIRTKSLSKAQITFIDNSILTLSRTPASPSRSSPSILTRGNATRSWSVSGLPWRWSTRS